MEKSLIFFCLLFAPIMVLAQNKINVGDKFELVDGKLQAIATEINSNQFVTLKYLAKQDGKNVKLDIKEAKTPLIFSAINEKLKAEVEIDNQKIYISFCYLGKNKKFQFQLK